MMKSMTAFAGSELSENGVTATVEIRGYNSRYLDPVIRLPSAYLYLEDFARQEISSRVCRGRLEARIGIKVEDGQTRNFQVNRPLAEAYFQALQQLRRQFDIREPVGLSHMLNAGGIIECVEDPADPELVRTLLRDCLQKALDSFDAMRVEEGRAMAEDISARLAATEAFVERIDGLRQGLVEACHQRLAARVLEMTRGTVEIDPVRIAQETAFLADKCDISEEVTRARSHVQQFRKLMHSDEPAGKPLNFLLQEMSREFNTMGVKAGSAEISHAVVAAKTEIEKLREQVQNIE